MDEQPIPKKKKPRTYIYDTKTTNMSFLQTAVDLKKLGIKNNMFFLKLYDRGLQGVDPFDPFLPEHLALRIIDECIVNPWYFLRECVKIPEQGGTGIRYQLNRGNLASTFCFLNGLDHYLVLPRQKGKTQSTLANIDWAYLFGTTNSEIMFINKRHEDANGNLDRLKQQRDLLPKFMHMKFKFADNGRIIEETNNVKTFHNPITNNKVVTKPSARSVEAAEGIGRGCTQPIQYYDEVEFTPHIRTIVQAAGPAFNTASSHARRNKAIYGRIFTSTPGDLDTGSGQEALKIIDETCKWTEQFYDWSKEEIEEYIEKNSGNGIIYIEYNFHQLGDDEEWFKRACQTVLNDPIKIKREIFLKRMRGSENSPFAPEELEALQELRGKVKEELMINKLFMLEIYEALKRDRVYLVGVDTSSGYGIDNFAVTVTDPYTLKIVAEFQSPYIGVTDMWKFLYSLVRRYIPKAILCVERNHNGEAIMDALRHTDISHTIYFDDTKDPLADSMIEKLDSKGFLQMQAARRRLYGIWTGGDSRLTMLSILETHMREHKEKFVGNNVINDILSLVKKPNGKIDHGSGFHDDALFSYLMTLYVYYHGKNLARFGFFKGSVPDEDERNKGLTYDEILEELPEESRALFEGMNIPERSMSDDDIFIQQIQQARRESDFIDKQVNATNRAENFDNFDDEELALDFFDELNK